MAAQANIVVTLSPHATPDIDMQKTYPHPTHTQGAKVNSDGIATPLSVAGWLCHAVISNSMFVVARAHTSSHLAIIGAMNLNTLSRSAEVRLKKKIKVGLVLYVLCQQEQLTEALTHICL